VRLRRSDPTGPGLARRRRGTGFSYLDSRGRRLTDPATLERIKGLAIPPAWEDVWVCPWPDGHLQAVGTDDAGRRQYLYHPDWRARRDRQKFVRAQELGIALPRLRARLDRAIGGRGLSQERVLATALRLVDLGLCRAGGEEYRRTNGSFGMATALRGHVTAVPGGVELSFPAKSGTTFSQEIHDASVVRVLDELVRRDDPSDQLLAWWSDEDEAWHPVRTSHLRSYLRSVAGEGLMVKDFRTWHASVLMATTLSRVEPPTSERGRRSALVEAYREVAEVLHNTPAVTRSSYVDPRVTDLWRAGEQLPAPGRGQELVPLRASRALVRLLGGDRA
jgi:DNA topoisomerase IB